MTTLTLPSRRYGKANAQRAAINYATMQGRTVVTLAVRNGRCHVDRVYRPWTRA